MTVLTKFGASEKKDQLPLVDENSQNEAKIEVTEEIPSEDVVQNLILIRQKPDARLRHVCCLLLSCILVLSVGIIGGVQMYMEMNQPNTVRYQGWCAIPYDNNNDAKLIEPHFRIASLPRTYFSANSRDVELLGDLPQIFREQNDDNFANQLRETFELGDNYEKIIVAEHHDGRQTKMLHDFASNTSGIIDADRCFVMLLNRGLVLQPNVFASTIQGQRYFDVSTVHSIMRAVLPPLADLGSTGHLIERECADRPTYKLKLVPQTIRKRSAEIPNYAKFTQFSGKHIQEIDIDNINELLAYEEKMADLV